MLYVFCGLPGSGKSTLAKQLAEKTTATIYCYDETPGANRRDSHGRAFEVFCQNIKVDLAEGKTVIADGTNTHARNRKKLLKAVKDIDCKKVLIIMDTPLEECIKRNASRKKRLSDLCILAIHAAYEPPNLDEGWDEIREVKTYESDFTGN